MPERGIMLRDQYFHFFLDYWQVTLIWSPYGDDSLIRSLLIDDTSPITILTWPLESR